MIPNKCPHCGSFTFGKLKPSKGTSHILIEANPATNSIIGDIGMLVEPYVCTTCKSVQLYCPAIKG